MVDTTPVPTARSLSFSLQVVSYGERGLWGSLVISGPHQYVRGLGGRLAMKRASGLGMTDGFQHGEFVVYIAMVLYFQESKSSVPLFVYHSMFHQSLLAMFSFYFPYRITEV